MPPVIKNAECRVRDIPRYLSPIKVIRYQRPKINLFLLHKRPVPYHIPPSHIYIPKESNAGTPEGVQKNSCMRRSLARKAIKAIVVKQKKGWPVSECFDT